MIKINLKKTTTSTKQTKTIHEREFNRRGKKNEERIKYSKF